MNWVLITSAINSHYDNVSVAQRFQQTLMTGQSLKQKLEPCRTLLIETAMEPLTNDQKQQLQLVFDGVVEFHGDHLMRQIHDCAASDVAWIKTPGELHALSSVIRVLPDVQPRDRVWKISGRYQLDHDYDVAQHDQPGRICLLARKPCVVYYVPDTELRHTPRYPSRYHSRLYSFCGSLLPVMQDRYQAMFRHVIDQYSAGCFTDIENTMFEFLHDLDPIELHRVGVSGQQADDLCFITE